MSKTTRRELDSGSQPKLRVAGELRVGLAIVEELLGGESTLEGGKDVLRRNTVTWGKKSANRIGKSNSERTGLVEHDRNVLVRVLEQREQDADLRNRVVGASSVPTHTAGGTGSREEHNGITQQLDIGQQSSFLVGGELGFGGIELDSGDR